MKYCPSCKREYRDETLRFCVDDGAILISGPPSEATLVAAPPVINLPPTVWQNPSQSNQAPRADSKAALTYVVFGLVVLLALIVGGAAVFLLRPSGTASPNNANGSSEALRPPADNRQTTHVSTPEDQRSPRVGIYDAAEEIVVRGERLSRSDVDSLSQVELRRLRNAIYARHGRMFNTPELQRFFDGRPWYTRRFEYNDRDLTASDKANLNLIVVNEGSVP
jgi:hypothetical protein